jgi:hypothetical protein
MDAELGLAYTTRPKFKKTKRILLPGNFLVICVSFSVLVFLAGSILFHSRLPANSSSKVERLESTLGINHLGSKRLLPIEYDVDYQEFPFLLESVQSFVQRISPRIEWSQSNPKAKDTIFISVPSYRDTLCSSTLEQIFRKARNPRRVFVGVCDQIDPEHDPECRAPEEFKQQVRYVRMHYKFSRGPTLARYIVSKLWDGEEFFFLIDAHSHFLQDWDEILVDQARRLPEPSRAIISHYPVAEDRLLGFNEYRHLPVICKVKWEGVPKNFMLQLCEDCTRLERNPGEISCVSAFIGAGFTFGPARMILDVPYDRYLPWLFQGEEMLMAARLWTSGWEFYAPITNLMSHVYGTRNHSYFGEVTRNPAEEEATFNRVRFLMGVIPTPPETNTFELKDLGMGKVRTLQEYLDFSGLDLINGKHESRCGKRFDRKLRRWIDSR